MRGILQYHLQKDGSNEEKPAYKIKFHLVIKTAQNFEMILETSIQRVEASQIPVRTDGLTDKTILEDLWIRID